jgi:hypothetical protein
MPEEFRVWKQRMEEAQRKSSGGSSSTANVPSSTPTAQSSNSNNATATSVATSIPALSYSSPEEAAEAFQDLLRSKNVNATMKLKEVQDLCSKDPRWEALKTQGEKRQALAEYQVGNIVFKQRCMLIFTIIYLTNRRKS